MTDTAKDVNKLIDKTTTICGKKIDSEIHGICRQIRPYAEDSWQYIVLNRYIMLAYISSVFLAAVVSVILSEIDMPEVKKSSLGNAITVLTVTVTAWALMVKFCLFIVYGPAMIHLIRTLTKARVEGQRIRETSNEDPLKGPELIESVNRRAVKDFYRKTLENFTLVIEKKGRLCSLHIEGTNSFLPEIRVRLLDLIVRKLAQETVNSQTKLHAFHALEYYLQLTALAPKLTALVPELAQIKSTVSDLQKAQSKLSKQKAISEEDQKAFEPLLNPLTLRRVDPEEKFDTLLNKFSLAIEACLKEDKELFLRLGEIPQHWFEYFRRGSTDDDKEELEKLKTDAAKSSPNVSMHTDSLTARQRPRLSDIQKKMRGVNIDLTQAQLNLVRVVKEEKEAGSGRLTQDSCLFQAFTLTRKKLQLTEASHLKQNQLLLDFQKKLENVFAIIKSLNDTLETNTQGIETALRSVDTTNKVALTRQMTNLKAQAAKASSIFSQTLKPLSREMEVVWVNLQSILEQFSQLKILQESEIEIVRQSSQLPSKESEITTGRVSELQSQPNNMAGIMVEYVVFAKKQSSQSKEVVDQLLAAFTMIVALINTVTAKSDRGAEKTQ